MKAESSRFFSNKKKSNFLGSRSFDYRSVPLTFDSNPIYGEAIKQ